MKEWLYLWLPRFFGCHCRSDRSFHFKGRQFPLCARCTGELSGIIVSTFLLWFWKPTILISAILLVPLILDGFVQRFTVYESTNARRFLTGFLFGIGLLSLVFQTSAMVFMFGVEYGQSLRMR